MATCFSPSAASRQELRLQGACRGRRKSRAAFPAEASAKSRALVSVPGEYAIGFPPSYRNDNGGIAIGYGYDAAGNINRAVCGGRLWRHRRALRNARDPPRSSTPSARQSLTDRSGCRATPRRCCDGTSRRSRPSLSTTTIALDDATTRGHVGDVVIWRVRGGNAAARPGGDRVPGGCSMSTASATLLLHRVPADGCCVYRDCPPSYVCVSRPMRRRPDELRAPRTFIPTIYPEGALRGAALSAAAVQRKAANGTNGGLPKNRLLRRETAAVRPGRQRSTVCLARRRRSEGVQ